MKTVLSWLLLLALYVAYLILGGAIFHHTECPHELEQSAKEWEEDKALALKLLKLKDILGDQHDEDVESVLQHVIQKDLNNLDLTTNLTVCKLWDFENSLFFSFTVVTTIGWSIDFNKTLYY